MRKIINFEFLSCKYLKKVSISLIRIKCKAWINSQWFRDHYRDFGSNVQQI